MEDYFDGSSDDEYYNRVYDDDGDGGSVYDFQEPEDEINYSLASGNGPSCKVVLMWMINFLFIFCSVIKSFLFFLFLGKREILAFFSLSILRMID